jgi:4-hydroxy-tetrahydrodipicolinate synthase
VGTTGETATLTMAEHMHVVRTCVEVVNGRVPVLAGAGSNSTAEALELARHAEAVGADGVLVVTPYYNRPSQEGLYRHYAALSQGMGLPIIVYNVPGRTSVDLAHETVVRLSHLPHVRGVKDATGDLARVSLMRLDCASGFRLFSGDDPSALGYVAQGGHGLISVTSNVAPEACVQRLAAALTGDRAAALAWQDKLIKLDRALFLDASPGPTKFALSQLGLCREEVRLPLSPCSETAKPQILQAMRLVGLL